MLDDAETRTRRAIEAILAYLTRCPLAADSEQGIAQWWLPETGVDVPITDLRTALDRLVHDKVMTRTILPDGSVIYRAATRPGP